jgi:dTDP-4-amino-4,6-dideoxygalactose transaminase
VNSGSSAVYVALGALQLDPGSEVVVPPITDPGGVMPVALLNCVPVVADAAPNSFNMGPEQLRAVLTEHTRAIIVAHIAGDPADMDPILAIARERRLPVIEDCAQSHGARYKGRFAGAMGDIAAFSTMSGKHHATGAQGGVVFTRSEELHWRAKRFADRGKPFNLESSSNVVAGLNLNSNDLAAAIGRVQLRKLPAIIAARQQIAAAIQEGLREAKAVSLGWQVPESESAYWFLRFYVDPSAVRVTKDEFARAVAAEGIPVGATYRHIPSEAEWFRERRVFGRTGYPWTCPDYKGDRNRTFPCPNAVAATEHHFIMSIHENYGTEEVRDIVAALLKVEHTYRQ